MRRSLIVPSPHLPGSGDYNGTSRFPGPSGGLRVRHICSFLLSSKGSPIRDDGQASPALRGVEGRDRWKASPPRIGVRAKSRHVRTHGTPRDRGGNPVGPGVVAPEATERQRGKATKTHHAVDRRICRARFPAPHYSSTTPSLHRFVASPFTSRYFAAIASSASGITRTAPTVAMKFVSPPQRGTRCACRCSGTPAPAALPSLMP